MTDYSVKRSYRGEVLVSPPGAPPLQGEWVRSKNGKDYFKLAPGDPAIPYRRTSSAGKNLKGGGDGLANWKASMAAIGTVMSKSVQSEVATLLNAYNGDPYYAGDDGGWRSGKRRLLDAVEQATQVAGANTASARGTELHHLCEMVNRGDQPRVVRDELVEPLKHYMEAVAGLSFLTQEALVVQDELQLAGSVDYLLRVPAGTAGPDGQPIDTDWVVVGDLKGLPLDTAIPTPGGWSTMGQLRPGDEVFGSDGAPCRVVAKSDTKRIGTFIVKFDDASQVVCDAEHLWWVVTGKNPRDYREEVLPVTEIADGVAEGKRYRVPVAGPLQLPAVELPIDPYVLGAWLGDGKHSDGSISKADDLFDVLESDGHTLGSRQVDGRSGVVTRTVLGLRTDLRESGLLRNKHIPDQYLRADHHQRLRLLQGLMDTDGTWNAPRRAAAFNSTDKGLALAVEELLLTLGQRPNVCEYTTNGFGKTLTAYQVSFTPVDIIPFRLPRKRERCVAGLAEKSSVERSRRRFVKTVEPGPDVETVCIAVDSPNNTYLCTEKFIPTHNTGKHDAAYPAGLYAQLAGYGKGMLYDQETNTRQPLHSDLNSDWGVLVHFPLAVEGSRVRFYWVDLNVGIEAARLNNRIDRMIAHFQSKAGKPVEFTL